MRFAINTIKYLLNKHASNCYNKIRLKGPYWASFLSKFIGLSRYISTSSLKSLIRIREVLILAMIDLLAKLWPTFRVCKWTDRLAQLYEYYSLGQSSLCATDLGSFRCLVLSTWTGSSACLIELMINLLVIMEH